MEKEWDLRVRTMSFAVSVLRFCRTLPHTDEAAEVARQLRRSASSSSAHYLAAKRNQSDADYTSKLSRAIEEADESIFWLEFLRHSGMAAERDIRPLREETNELIAIFVASRSTAVERRARKRKRVPKPKPQPGRMTEHRIPDSEDY